MLNWRPAPDAVGNWFRDPHRQRLARLTLVAFLLTFVMARILVLLIMTGRLPDLYLHVGGTHVHHLNYGIFLLTGVGAWLLFSRPDGRSLAGAGMAYGIGLGLTFDEFGMWLHLGGAYWQRASFDAVIVIAALLTLLSLAPALPRFRLRHWLATAAIVAALIPFSWLLEESLGGVTQRLGEQLKEIEAHSPP